MEEFFSGHVLPNLPVNINWCDSHEIDLTLLYYSENQFYDGNFRVLLQAVGRVSQSPVTW